MWKPATLLFLHCSPSFIWSELTSAAQRNFKKKDFILIILIPLPDLSERALGKRQSESSGWAFWSPT